MHPTRRNDLELATAGKDVLVHDVEAGRVHVLNGGAGRLFELCDGTRSIDELARSYRGDADVDLAIVRGDVERIVAEFERLGLLQASA